LRQGNVALDVSALASIDGTNNFKDSYSPAVGAIVSRRFGDIAAVYLEPIWVNNTNQLPKELTDNNDTFLIGVGARVRIRPTVYLVGEVAPRTGYKPAVNHGSFAIEKRAGGHTFQLNFSNAFGTTMGQIRGAVRRRQLVHGFNISRKFTRWSDGQAAIAATAMAPLRQPAAATLGCRLPPPPARRSRYVERRGSKNRSSARGRR
jgi:hypothetical protein